VVLAEMKKKNEKTQYTKFCNSFGIEENVSSLDVSMNDTATVNELQRRTHLITDARDL